MNAQNQHVEAGEARMAQLDAEERKALAALGGFARRDAMTQKQRTRSARKAAKARWESVKSRRNSLRTQLARTLASTNEIG